MSRIQVFNGDADGLCALQQLRLAEPGEAELVTGVKRDIQLVARVQAQAQAGDQVDVLDLSLDKNREAVEALLAKGVRVRYFDHHFAGRVPEHPGLEAHLDPASDRGTSLIVDESLDGRFRAWAVVGTFGDNLDTAARQAASVLDLDPAELERLRMLGIYLNYNSYGATEADLHIPPAALFRRIHPFTDPLRFMAQDPTYRALEEGYRQDMARADRLEPELETERHALYLLPAEAWARRVSGVWANRLARRSPDRAHALLTRLPEGGFVVSVRAPLARPEGADQLCRRFATGGGRKAAAGINQLPDAQYPDFVQAFREAFPG